MQILIGLVLAILILIVIIKGWLLAVLVYGFMLWLAFLGIMRILMM
jgi:hypothetical protein